MAILLLMDLTTPALLFPAISLLLLAYTNRFLTLAAVLRSLAGNVEAGEKQLVQQQVANLKMRIYLIRLMQSTGVTSFLFCALSMLGLFMDWVLVGKLVFGISLLLLVVSLFLSLWEVNISTRAINVELERIDRRNSA